MNYKTTTTMNKLRQILQFIRALLGFLLGLKKKETTEKEEKVALPDNQPVVARVLPGDTPCCYVQQGVWVVKMI
jgi:hypothetical protein